METWGVIVVRFFHWLKFMIAFVKTDSSCELLAFKCIRKSELWHSERLLPVSLSGLNVEGHLLRLDGVEDIMECFCQLWNFGSCNPNIWIHLLIFIYWLQVIQVRISSKFRQPECPVSCETLLPVQESNPFFRILSSRIMEKENQQTRGSQ